MIIIINAGKHNVFYKIVNNEFNRKDASDDCKDLLPEDSKHKTAILSFIERIIHYPETAYFLINGHAFKNTRAKFTNASGKITEEMAALNIFMNLEKFLEFCQEHIPEFADIDCEKYARTLLDGRMKENPKLTDEYLAKSLFIDCARGNLGAIMAYDISKKDAHLYSYMLNTAVRFPYLKIDPE